MFCYKQYKNALSFYRSNFSFLKQIFSNKYIVIPTNLLRVYFHKSRFLALFTETERPKSISDLKQVFSDRFQISISCFLIFFSKEETIGKFEKEGNVLLLLYNRLCHFTDIYFYDGVYRSWFSKNLLEILHQYTFTCLSFGKRNIFMLYCSKCFGAAKYNRK